MAIFGKYPTNISPVLCWCLSHPWNGAMAGDTEACPEESLWGDTVGGNSELSQQESGDLMVILMVI